MNIIYIRRVLTGGGTKRNQNKCTNILTTFGLETPVDGECQRNPVVRPLKTSTTQ